MWGGLVLSYVVGQLPASTAIIGLAAGTYAIAGLWARLRAGRRSSAAADNPRSGGQAQAGVVA
jgi:hypothetical protein